ncbi:MAG: dienelactone hydrolase family protein [Paracoccaceae bacterium]|nr:dienelactone hydrolase family protein [Paracoccaceae bacterium]
MNASTDLPLHVTIPAAGGRVRLDGALWRPEAPRGLVIFAHGSGSSQFSPRNRHVARLLHGAGLAALLFDLLTPAEAAERAQVFDIPLLSGRVRDAIDWAERRDDLAGLPIGLFGASTGAAAALVAAAGCPGKLAAVVSRGGRPDLAQAALADVHLPVLLIVGGADRAVLAVNQAALARLPGPKALRVVPGATHLFEEPGAIEQVETLARDWFLTHLCPAPGRGDG